MFGNMKGEEAGARWLEWVVGVVWFAHIGIKEIKGDRAGGDESDVLLGLRRTERIEWI